MSRHPLAADDYESLVLGDQLPMAIGQFKRQAAVIIEAEQDKANPDNALIEFACNAIRLAREHGNLYHQTLDAIARSIERRKQAERARIDGGTQHG